MNNPMQPVACPIIEIRHETQTEYTFRIQTDIKVSHGQFLQLSLPKVGECPISVSESGSGWLEFTVRKVGRVTDAFFEQHPGDLIFLRGPYGKGWPVEEISNKHLIIIAGGTGVSPVRSLINACMDDRINVKSLSLICGFKNEDSILFADEIENWKNRFDVTCCLDTGKKIGWETGFVTEYIHTLPVSEFGDEYTALVVGPPPMMKAAGKELIKNGISDKKIWMSFERKMSCAIGKCGHCRIDEIYVCLDGPVFPYALAKELVD